MTTPPPITGNVVSRGLTAWSLGALGLGLASGIAARAAGVGDSIAPIVAPAGQLWLAALQAIALPLILTQLLVAIIGSPASVVGRLGGRAVAFFVLALAAGAVFAVTLSPVVIAWLGPERASAIATGVTPPAVPARASGIGDAISGLLPTNIIAAAARGDLLQLVLCTVLIGLAINQLPAERRVVPVSLIRALADTMFVLVRWVLVGMPLGVLILTFGLAVGMGGGAIELVVVYSIIVSIVLVLFTVFLYPVTMAAGRIRLGAFARAAAPAQLIGATTRSSLAALPALVEGARTLGLPSAAGGFVLPLSTSVFKVGRPVSSTTKLLFLAHIYGVDLTPIAVATFVLTSLALSFTTPGIPSGGSTLRAVPLYLAAGIPIDGVVVLSAADAIPDIFRTVANVTGDLSAAAIVSPSASRSVSVVPDAEPLPRAS